MSTLICSFKLWEAFNEGIIFCNGYRTNFNDSYLFVYETGTHDSKPQQEIMSSHTTQPHSVSISKTVDKEANVGISDSQSSQIPTAHNDNQQLETMISRKHSGLTMDICKHTSPNVSSNSSEISGGIQSKEALISSTEEHDNPIDKSTMPNLPPADLIDRLLQRPKVTKSPCSIEQSNQLVVMDVPKAESSVKDSGYSTRHTKLAQSTIFQQVGTISSNIILKYCSGLTSSSNGHQFLCLYVIVDMLVLCTENKELYVFKNWL